MDADPPPVVFLMGPTATGKTEAATCLCDRLNGELVSVDSVQLYRQLDIGSAKPTARFLARYPHWLINIRNIDQTYSVADFCADAKAAVQSIQARGKLPILVGGTMFYFAALEGGLASLPGSDAEVRAEIAAQVKQQGLAAVYRELVTADPELAARLQPTDSQRVERALEIYRLTGQPPTRIFAAAEAAPLDWRVLKFALAPTERARLHRRIEQRFDAMLAQGLVAEVERIVAEYPAAAQLPALRSVGYRQVVDYLAGRVAKDQLGAVAAAATRQLAKRQLTWLRNQSGVVWIDGLSRTCRSSLLTYLKEALGGGR